MTQKQVRPANCHYSASMGPATLTTDWAQVALLGNPNAGKSTVFNALTGLRQHVGNWPGKTVERATGECPDIDPPCVLVDLPGIYSISARSPEEQVARDYILSDRADLYVVVVDATNLERNLYLLVQLLELTENVVVALNMSDMTRTNGTKIDLAGLSTGLGGIPIVPTAAASGEGLEDLKLTIGRQIRRWRVPV